LDDQNTFLSTLFNTSIETVGAFVNGFQFIDISREDVIFYFYPSDGSEPVPVSSKNCTRFMDPKVDTKFIIHGWTDNALLPWIRNMSTLYHEKGKYNVIAPDWSKDADQNYVYAASAIQGVGYMIGDFIIDIVKKHNKDFLQIVHVIGHSMGGQGAGFAGQRVITELGKNISRISGLDVASPLFEIPVLRPPDLRLSPTDADFTDLIHTQLGFRGLISPGGKVDFYVNTKNVIQPGCTDDLPHVGNASKSISICGRWVPVTH
jgi:pimeloyl-ACP methyl ester carboxylesterase